MPKEFHNRTCLEHKIGGMMRRYETRGENWEKARQHKKFISELKKDPIAYEEYMNTMASIERGNELRKQKMIVAFMFASATLFLFGGLLVFGIGLNEVGYSPWSSFQLFVPSGLIFLLAYLSDEERKNKIRMEEQNEERNSK